MAARSDTLGQDLKIWAADQLQIELGATPEKIRAAYYQQVQRENGVPNLAAREALLILTGRNQAARPALALEAAEEKLQRELDAFACRFFSLAITERKAEWEMLHARGKGLLRVDAWLSVLRPGLYIVLPQIDRETHLGQLVSVVCELFVLRPAARAIRRQGCLADVGRSGEKQSWVKAAKLLKAKHPAVAALEPTLVARLAGMNTLAAAKKSLKQRMRKVGKQVRPWQIVLIVLGVWFAVARIVNQEPLSYKSNARPYKANTPQSIFNPPPDVILEKLRQPDEVLEKLLEKSKLRIVKEGDKWKLKEIPNEDPLLDKDNAKPLKAAKDNKGLP